jgi:type IV fimbrial biogenesis protein FimT
MPQRGFTLLELLIAVLVFAVVGAIAAPAYRRALAGWRLSAAARQVVLDLKIARARAILDSATHRVRFSVPGNSYQHERQRPSGTYEPAGPPTDLPSDVAVVACTAAGSGISFRPRGTAGAFGSVSLRNAEGDLRAVIVDIVGRVRVQ